MMKLGSETINNFGRCNAMGVAYAGGFGSYRTLWGLLITLVIIGAFFPNFFGYGYVASNG